ncbi:hypothetical protein [Marivivens marinus]|uniref:hypothetical protein n=1 Tax=Marivivens marinus TaxID=3110173 RepID=UPI003B849639
MAQSQSRTRAARRAKTPRTRPDSRDAFIWDTEVPQLAERRRGAARSWIVQTRAGGRSLRRKIGDVEEMPSEVARALAREVLAVLSSMMRHAELLGLRPSGANPCAGLRRHKSDFAADFLDPAGYAVLGRVLDRAADRFPLAVPFVRFVALGN